MNKGFTLIEVLVVSLIVAILSSVAIPTFQGYIDRASSQVCEHTAAMILKSVIALVYEHPDITGSYTPETLSDQYSLFNVSVPPEFTVDIFIGSADEIMVIVQDDMYMGSAEIGT